MINSSVAYIILISAAVFSIARNRILHGKNIISRENIMKLIFYVYAASVIGVTLFPVFIYPSAIEYSVTDFVNPVPFNYLRVPFSESVMLNIVGNFLLLMPLCILYKSCGYRGSDSLPSAAVTVFCVSLAIEVIQFIENFAGLTSVTVRIVDIDDLILNTAGGIAGYLIYAKIRKSKNKERDF